MNSFLDILLLAGAIAWWSTALVHKDGPFRIFDRFKKWTILIAYKLRATSPLACTFCTGFWVGLIILSAFASGDESFRALIQFFGVLGIASAIRGASAEF